MVHKVVILWIVFLVVDGLQMVNASVYKKVYERYNVKRDWQGAREYCMDEQGDLATIKSEEENNAVIAQLDRGDNKNYWLGMWKYPAVGNTTNYTWIDGSFDWGRLKNYHNLDDEHCVRLEVNNNEKHWNNMPCNEPLKFICQFYEAVNVTDQNCTSNEVTPQTSGEITNKGVKTTVDKFAEHCTTVPTLDEQRTTGNKETTVSVSDNVILSNSTKGNRIPEIDLDDADEDEEESDSDMKSSDYRTSAKAIGGTSIIFLAFFFGVIIVMDLGTFTKNLKQMKRNLSR